MKTLLDCPSMLPNHTSELCKHGPIRWVLIRDPLGQFKSQALLSTNLTLTPTQLLTWFVQRWQLEVTFEEVRAHLGVETQRQWSGLAIARTTPALLALFSLVTLFADQLLRGQPLPPRQAAWYSKHLATFSDTLAFVRAQVWPSTLFRSPTHYQMWLKCRAWRSSI